MNMNMVAWLLVFSAIVLKIDCIDISSNFLEPKQLDCLYNSANGDLVCDCKNRNKVIDDFAVFFRISKKLNWNFFDSYSC